MKLLIYSQTSTSIPSKLLSTVTSCCESTFQHWGPVMWQVCPCHDVIMKIYMMMGTYYDNTHFLPRASTPLYFRHHTTLLELLWDKNIIIHLSLNPESGSPIEGKLQAYFHKENPYFERFSIYELALIWIFSWEHMYITSHAASCP